MERKYFKVGISVNFEKEINLLQKWVGIEKLAEMFSYDCNYKRDIKIYDFEDNIMYLLIAANTKCREPKKTILRLISSFLKSMCLFFEIVYDTRKHYFTVDECFELNYEEYKALKLEAIGKLVNYQCNDEIEVEEIPDPDDDILEEEEIEEIDPEVYGQEKDILIPKRQFPYISTNSSRSGGGDKREHEEFKSYRDVLNKLNSFIGISDVKKKINGIAEFIASNNKRYVELDIENPGLYYNFVISGGRGTGKNAIAKIIYNLLYQLGVIGNGRLINIDSKEVYPGNTLDRYLGNTQSGVVFIDSVHVLDVNDKRGQKDYQGTFDSWFTQYKDNFVFILAGEPEGINNLMKEHEISKHINFRIDIADYSDDEILDLIRYFAQKEKYKVATEAEGVILKTIEYCRESGCFENIYTAKNIVEKAIIKKGLRGDRNTSTAEDFIQEELVNREDLKPEETSKEPDPLEELKNMIGLSETKRRVEEIAAFAAAQLRRKELGLEKETVCLHMNFSGSPGTGKTTVARIIGRIFKKLGILSKGHFVEVAREDLVGKYVGHTAVKTAEKIKEAEGGILFVDEAYSLASESRVDFGYEAISTLVKKMEDMRNNLVVIFAGYEEEMKGLMNMNPGLKDRIQFNVIFKDYKPSELMEIWTKFFKDNNYSVSEEAVIEMNRIVQILYDSKTYNFANGRVMRKCFERARIHQAMRIMREKHMGVEELMKIEAEDIRGLYSDKDVIPEVRKVEGKRCIGFER